MTCSTFLDRAYRVLCFVLGWLVFLMICTTFSMVREIHDTQRTDNQAAAAAGQSILALRTLNTQLDQKSRQLARDLTETSAALYGEAVLRVKAEARIYELETVLKYQDEQKKNLHKI